MADEPHGRNASPPDDPRAAILRRRARFIERSLASTACAAALSCTPARDGAQDPGSGGPVVSVAAEGGSAAPVGGEVPTSTAPPSAPKTGARPPLETPGGISENAKQRYESLNAAMKDVHDNLDAAESALRNCDLKKSECEKAFIDAATGIHDANRTLRMMYHCPGSSDEAKAYARYEEEHLAHARMRLGAVTEAANAAAASAAQKWQQIQDDIAKARAYPCLSFACLDW